MEAPLRLEHPKSNVLERYRRDKRGSRTVELRLNQVRLHVRERMTFASDAN
jgi:hypothetical protein